MKEMNWTFAQVSISFYAEADRGRIKQVVNEAMCAACSHIEKSLEHESVGYNFTQFKTDYEILPSKEPVEPETVHYTPLEPYGFEKGPR